MEYRKLDTLDFRPTISPARAAGMRLRNLVLLAPFALMGGAGAQAEIATIAGNAQGSVDAVKTAVVALIGVGVIIVLLFWGAKKLRPA
jgi:delta-aminolevulinic acid dehydratase/porphobilinogen synthase